MIRKLFLFAVILFLWSFAYGQAKRLSVPVPADTIRALDNEWLTAYDRNDVESIRRIFAEDVRMVHSDGRVTTKSDELTNVKAATPPELRRVGESKKLKSVFTTKPRSAAVLPFRKGTMRIKNSRVNTDISAYTCGAKNNGNWYRRNTAGLKNNSVSLSIIKILRVSI
jgi:hypothetical protein